MRIKKFFKRGARDNFVRRGLLLLTLLCEIHMVEFSRGRGTDLSHPLSSGLTHYILFIIRDFSKSTATLVYCALVVVSLIKSTKNLDIISVFTVNRSCTAKVCPSTDHYSCFFKLHKYFHYFRSHRYCNLKYSEE